MKVKSQSQKSNRGYNSDSVLCFCQGLHERLLKQNKLLTRQRSQSSLSRCIKNISMKIFAHNCFFCLIPRIVIPFFFIGTSSNKSKFCKQFHDY